MPRVLKPRGNPVELPTARKATDKLLRWGSVFQSKSATMTRDPLGSYGDALFLSLSLGIRAYACSEGANCFAWVIPLGCHPLVHRPRSAALQKQDPTDSLITGPSFRHLRPFSDALLTHELLQMSLVHRIASQGAPRTGSGIWNSASSYLRRKDCCADSTVW